MSTVLVAGGAGFLGSRLCEHLLDPARRCPDITLARRTLTWEPRVSLADGLAETVAYFRRRLASS